MESICGEVGGRGDDGPRFTELYVLNIFPNSHALAWLVLQLKGKN